jgi:hypothetical protein
VIGKNKTMEPINTGDWVQIGEDKYVVGEIGEHKADLIGADGQKYSTPLHKMDWFKVLARAGQLKPFFVSKAKIEEEVDSIDKLITVHETETEKYHTDNECRIEHLNIRKHTLNKILKNDPNP